MLAGAVPATSFTPLFSDLEGILTLAFYCSEVAALEEIVMLGYTGLVHLSHLSDAIIEEGESDTTNAPDNVPRDKARAIRSFQTNYNN